MCCTVGDEIYFYDGQNKLWKNQNSVFTLFLHFTNNKDKWVKMTLMKLGKDV